MADSLCEARRQAEMPVIIDSILRVRWNKSINWGALNKNIALDRDVVPGIMLKVTREKVEALAATQLAERQSNQLRDRMAICSRLIYSEPMGRIQHSGLNPSRPNWTASWCHLTPCGPFGRRLIFPIMRSPAGIVLKFRQNQKKISPERIIFFIFAKSK